MSPLESLKSAETGLIRQIRSVANAIDGIGNTSTTEALEDLRAAAAACESRLRSTADAMARTVADLAAFASSLVSADVCGIDQQPTSTPTAAQETPGPAQATTPRPEVAKALEATQEPKLYPCCDNPDCDLCHGSGIARDDNPKVRKLNAELARLTDVGEPVPPVSDGSPFYGSEEPLGVGTGVPVPSANGTSKPRRRKK